MSPGQVDLENRRDAPSRGGGTVAEAYCKSHWGVNVAAGIEINFNFKRVAVPISISNGNHVNSQGNAISILLKEPPPHF